MILLAAAIFLVKPRGISLFLTTFVSQDRNQTMIVSQKGKISFRMLPAGLKNTFE